MREIKFRAWFLGSKTMQDWASISHRLSHADSHWYFNNPKIILMQYTGLKDKSGVEIYEGDIVTITYGIPPISDKLIVEYADNKVVADISVSGWWLRNTIENCESGSLCKTYEDSLEIIGNIYENPGLVNV